MFVLRALTGKDVEALFELAKMAHSGVTSLPKNFNLLKRKALLSESTFSNPNTLNDEIFLFILEDLESKKAVGVSGIYTKSGKSRIPYLYRLASEKDLASLPITVLYPFTYESEVTEIGSLFLEKSYRKGGLGKLLSFGRFLYMADHINRFDESTIASLRGFFTENDECPFYEGIAKKLIGLNYEEAASHFYDNREDLKKAVSPFPIILEFLEKALQQMTGAIHPNTISAKKMLFNQGFAFNKLLDPLDGGPLVEAKTKEIQAIKTSYLAKVSKKSVPVLSQIGFIARKNPFKATLANFEKVSDSEIALDEAVKKALELSDSDFIRIYTEKKDNDRST